MADRTQLPSLPEASDADNNDLLLKRNSGSGADEKLSIETLFERLVEDYGGASGLLVDNSTNRPSAGVEDRLFLETDTGAVYRDDGSEWTELLRVQSVSPDADSVVVRTGDGRVRSESGGSGDEAVTHDDTSTSADADTVAKRDGSGRVKSESGGSGTDSVVWDDASTTADADTVALRDGDGGLSVDTATKSSHALRSDQISPSHLRKGKREAIFAPTNDNQELEVRHDIYIGVDGRIRKISEGTSVDLSEVSLTKGTDYVIWMTSGGDLVADESLSSPPESGAVLVGGIHYAPGSNADLDPNGDWSNHSGGNDTPQFNQYSAWDLKWRPTVSDPRGLTLVAESFWCGIYMLAADHMTGVVHRNGTKPARDDDPPQNPYDENGGRYDDANFFNVSEALAYHGFQNLNIQEFQLAAIGVKEEASRGDDLVLTGIGEDNTGSENPDEAFTSHWGCIQMTGCIRLWSRDMMVTGSDESTSSLQGRGGRNRYDRAVALGQFWGYGSESGSRSSYSSDVENSGSMLGGRGRAGHLILV